MEAQESVVDRFSTGASGIIPSLFDDRTGPHAGGYQLSSPIGIDLGD